MSSPLRPEAAAARPRLDNHRLAQRFQRQGSRDRVGRVEQGAARQGDAEADQCQPGAASGRQIGEEGGNQPRLLLRRKLEPLEYFAIVNFWRKARNGCCRRWSLLRSDAPLLEPVWNC